MDTKDLTIKADELGNQSDPIAVPPRQEIEPNTLDQFTIATPQETQAVDTATQKLDQTQGDIFSELFGGDTQETQRLKAEEQAGLGELRTIDKDILNEQVVTTQRFDRERQAITNETGLTAAQKQARLNDVSRKQNFELADIAVRKFVASNDLANASAAVDRKLTAQFAEQKQKVDGLKFIADFYEGKQKTALEAVAKKEERAYEKAFAEAKTFENIKLTGLSNASLAGAGAGDIARLNSTTNMEEFLEAGGSRFLTDPVSKAQLTKLNMEIKTLRDREKAIANGDIVLSEKDKDIVLKLQDDYDKQSGEFIKQTDAYNRIIASAEDPSAAGDLALIFNYMKVLDPGSTVREGEFANAQEAASYANRIYGAGIKLGTGKRLTDTQRTDFVDRATRLYEKGYEQQQSLDSQFEKRAKQLNVPGDYVTRDLSSVAFNGTNSVKDSVVTQEERDSIPIIEGLDAVIQGAIPNTGNSYIDFSFD